ncbi:MAG: geranylgeranyl reductase family protein [Vicinamibacterales bacterium]
MHDVVIVGAGPGGLFAAAELASRGLDAVVFEEHDDPGSPVHCTGIMAAEAFDEFDLPRDAILHPLRSARFFGPSRTFVEYVTGSRRTQAVVIDRRLFDAELCVRARNAGATVLTGKRVTDVRIDGRGVTLVFAGGEAVRGRACVLACGANYRFQKRLGLGMTSRYLRSAQLELPAPVADHTEVHFGLDTAPGGFAWAVPVRRPDRQCARVGVMCSRDARRYFDAFLQRVVHRWDFPEMCRAGLRPRSKLLPLGTVERTYTDRLVVVGDAAGLVKPTTGGGIYCSILSASIAAEILANAIADGDLRAAALGEYERRWRSKLADEFDAQALLRSVAVQLSDESMDELIDLVRTDGIMQIVRRTVAFNRHRRMIMSLLVHPAARRILKDRVLGTEA